MDKSGPSRRTIIGWSVVMLLLLGLSLFIGLVVVPIWHTRSVVQEYASSRQSLGTGMEEAVIQRLGGPEDAVDRLRTYVRLPEWAEPKKDNAAYLLMFCGRKGELVHYPASNLASFDRLEPRDARPAAKEAAGVLAGLLEDDDLAVRKSAAFGLAWIGPEARAAIPALERMLKDDDATLRHAAVQALKKIRSRVKEPGE